MINKKNKIPISEIFKSIQGEGKYAGTPCIFVRFFGCTLHCRFNGVSCDTPYAVTGNTFVSLPIKEIVSEIKKCLGKDNSIHHIVFTGGEPGLYQKQIIKIIDKLDESEELMNIPFFYEIETNGTIELIDEIDDYIDHFNLSIKLKSSNQPDKFEKKRLNLDAIKSYPFKKSCFKFVVSSKEDLNEIISLHTTFPEYDIMLMPQGETREEMIKNSPYVIDLCIQYGFRFSLRQHIMIWDNKKGV